VGERLAWQGSFKKPSLLPEALERSAPQDRFGLASELASGVGLNLSLVLLVRTPGSAAEAQRLAQQARLVGPDVHKALALLAPTDCVELQHLYIDNDELWE
jgi:hypothetical protein